MAIAGEGWSEIRYQVRPLCRGELVFGLTQTRVTSACGLWQRNIRVGTPAVTHVYPNFAALTKYALLAIDNRLSQIGILQRRRRGRGPGFSSIARVPRRRHAAPDRLEGDGAHRGA